MILNFFFIFVLIFLNGFFVAAEFAFVKVRASQLDILIKTGSKAAVTAKGILAELNAYLAATQLGITIASLLLGWLGEQTIAALVMDSLHRLDIQVSQSLTHIIATTAAITLTTIMHVVFGESIPKTLAISKSESVTLAVAYVMRGFYWVFRPFIWLLNSMSNGLLRLAGFDPTQGEGVHSVEEIRYLVEQGKESGTMEDTNYDIIKNAFDFPERTARQVMVPRTRLAALNANLSNEELIGRVIEEGFSRMPVYKDSLDNIIGVVYAKDILGRLRKQAAVDVKALIRPIHFIPQNQKITRLLRQFQRDRLHMAVVVDEYGGTAGIITMEDIIEELVGEIQDEHDNETPIVEKIGDDEYRVLASAPITDVNEHLPHPLAESKNYESLSGMLSYNLGRIPDSNEKAVLEDYEFTVLKRTRNNVTLVQIRDLAEAE